MYERIAAELKRRAREADTTLKELHTEQRFLLQQAEVASEQGCRAECARLAEEVARVKVALDVHQAQVKVATEALAQGRRDQEKLKAKQEAFTALAVLLAQEKGIAGQRTLYERAERARGLRSVETVRNQRRTEAEEAAKQYCIAQAKLELAQQQYQQAQQRLEAEDTASTEREQLRQELETLRRYQMQVAELAEPRTHLQTEQKEQKRLADRYTGLGQDLQTTKEAQEQYDKRVQALQRLAETLETHRAKIPYQQQLYDNRERYETAKGELTQKTQAWEQARQDEEQAEAVFRTAQAYREAQEAQWMHQQAAYLAQQLQEATPCPVCGSLEHPAPAGADGALLSEAELNKGRKATREKEKVWTKASRERGVKETDRMAVLTRHDELKLLLGEAAEQEVSVIQSVLKTIEQAAREADDAQAMLTTLQPQGERLVVEIQRIQTEMKGIEGSQREVDDQLIRLEAQIAEREGQIPLEYRSVPTLGKVIKTTETAYSTKQATFERVRAEAVEADKTLAAAISTEQAKCDQAQEAEGHKMRAEAEFAEQLRTTAFEDESDYNRAHKDEHSLRQLKQQLEAFEQNLLEARTRYQSVEQAAVGLVMPDLEVMQAKYDNAVKEREAAIRLETELQERHKRMQEALDRIGNKATEIAEAEVALRLVKPLDEIANGRVHNFQRFVLATVLDRVLGNASERLATISHHRYQLRRKVEITDGRKSTGLDLEVFDAYTGKYRDVQTLSGGEGFLAALALALGLADEAQRHSGSIQLDTIFVDEGFGSLDKNALEQVMRELENLQAQGRLVSIISHVQELQELIPTRLEIIKGKGGSQARFVLQ